MQQLLFVFFFFASGACSCINSTESMLEVLKTIGESEKLVKAFLFENNQPVARVQFALVMNGTCYQLAWARNRLYLDISPGSLLFLTFGAVSPILNRLSIELKNEEFCEDVDRAKQEEILATILFMEANPANKSNTFVCTLRSQSQECGTDKYEEETCWEVLEEGKPLEVFNYTGFSSSTKEIIGLMLVTAFLFSVAFTCTFYMFSQYAKEDLFTYTLWIGVVVSGLVLAGVSISSIAFLMIIPRFRKIKIAFLVCSWALPLLGLFSYLFHPKLCLGENGCCGKHCLPCFAKLPTSISLFIHRIGVLCTAIPFIWFLVCLIMGIFVEPNWSVNLLAVIGGEAVIIGALINRTLLIHSALKELEDGVRSRCKEHWFIKHLELWLFGAVLLYSACFAFFVTTLWLLVDSINSANTSFSLSLLQSGFTTIGAAVTYWIASFKKAPSFNSTHAKQLLKQLAGIVENVGEVAQNRL